jgi:hypothetical protein
MKVDLENKKIKWIVYYQRNNVDGIKNRIRDTL